MHYIDREGRRITQSQWRSLFLDTAYSVVHRSLIGAWTVTTSWVGVALECEKVPLLFCVAADACGGKDGQPGGEPLFFSSLTQALEYHSALEKKIATQEKTA